MWARRRVQMPGPSSTVSWPISWQRRATWLTRPGLETPLPTQAAVRLCTVSSPA